MKHLAAVMILLLSTGAVADFAEIGSGGTLVTNRPFCGS